jgi:hypothetical protein
MCTHVNPNMVLLQIDEKIFKIPVCHVVCCDMGPEDLEDWFEHLTNPIQVAFKAKQLEVNVRDLTARVTKLSKLVEKPQSKLG